MVSWVREGGEIATHARPLAISLYVPKVCDDCSYIREKREIVRSQTRRGRHPSPLRRGEKFFRIFGPFVSFAELRRIAGSPHSLSSQRALMTVEGRRTSVATGCFQIERSLPGQLV